MKIPWIPLNPSDWSGTTEERKLDSARKKSWPYSQEPRSHLRPCRSDFTGQSGFLAKWHVSVWSLLTHQSVRTREDWCVFQLTRALYQLALVKAPLHTQHWRSIIGIILMCAVGVQCVVMQHRMLFFLFDFDSFLCLWASRREDRIWLSAWW